MAERVPVLVEVLVESLENEEDVKLVAFVKRVASEYEGVEVRVFTWLGPHEYPFSIGILDAYKLHACPAVVVNGFLVAAGEEPSEDVLRAAIDGALRTGEFRTSRCV